VLIAQAAGILLALGASVSWGGADFAGGLVSRRIGSLKVFALSRIGGFASYATFAVISREPFPPVESLVWAAAAGAAGGLGIAALYRGLATEHSALVVPTSGVVGAAIPVLFAAVFQGVLPAAQQVGLVTALVGIWLVSTGHGSTGAAATRGLGYGALAGIGFGGFFVFLAQVESGHVFTPLAVAGCASLSTAILALKISRQSLPSPKQHPVALIAGVLDAVGAVCYLLAVQWIRLDVAAVLGSLYPAVTVLLFRLTLREQVSRMQWVGLVVCVAAIALIAM
jgi:drug/metabolite transporter (DMT)-like permease